MPYLSPWSPPLPISSDGAVVAGAAAQPSNPMVPLAFRAASADGRRIAGSTLAASAPSGMPFASLPYQAPCSRTESARARARMRLQASISVV